MSVDEFLGDRREDVLQIAHRHGVNRLYVFGSIARGEADQNSDIDFLIEVGGSTTPWFPGGLVSELEALLGRRVDVVESDAIREPFREEILRSAVPL